MIILFLRVQFVEEDRNLSTRLSRDYIISTLKFFVKRKEYTIVISNVLRQMLTDYWNNLQHLNIEARSMLVKCVAK